MKTLACSLLLTIASLPLFAAEERPESEMPAPVEPPALEVKHKSSFTLDETSRNPFWPIGWKPSPKQANSNPTEHVGPEISPNAFVVTSITLDQGAKFAIINGRAMSEGQVFGLQMGNQTYQISVKAIQDGQVILLRRDQEIAVPLRRR